MATASIYPYEIVSLVRTKKSFGIEARFDTDFDPTHPLQMMGGRYSRFVLAIVADGKRETANLPIDLLPDIAARTNFAFTKSMEGTAGNSSPAFTVTFAVGKYKGRTPADVRKTDGVDALRAEYKFLRDNVTKYPGNRKIMDAVTEAAKMSEEELNAHTPASPVTLFEIGCRPLVRRTRPEDGFCECYETRGFWDASRNYPVTVTITRYFAPVTKMESGQLNVQLSRKDQKSVRTTSFSMLGSEWLNCVEQMKASVSMFSMLHIRDGWKAADEADKKHRDEWRAEHAETSAADFMPAPEDSVPDFSAAVPDEEFELFSEE